ncbi:MAG: PaaX family transcriptional regulator C-terminal domain-containing protein [Gemmatimonadales bacterium]
MRDAYLSSLRVVPTSYFVYSSISFYGPERDGEIPGTWFVRALGELGRSAEAVRMELYRMERDGELTAKKAGRVKLYQPTAVARAEVDAGLRKIMGEPARKWNGRWTIVHFQFTSKQRVARDRLRSLLQVEGFAPIGDGLYLHPRHPSAGLVAAVKSMKAEKQLTLFTGAEVARKDIRVFAAATWDLDAVSQRYTEFHSRFAPLERKAKTLSAPHAFAARFAVVFDYLSAAWADPELPSELLPPSWPGDKARKLAQSLYRQLLPEAIRHAHAIDNN